MKFAAATTLFFAALALANPAPVAHPEAAAGTLVDAKSLAPEIDARAAGIILEAREPKGSKGGSSGSKGGNSTDDSAALTITPNVMLQLSALGLGYMLWA